MARPNPSQYNLISTYIVQAHVVSAFEHSLANMTSRLSQLTVTAEEKVSEPALLTSESSSLSGLAGLAGLSHIAVRYLQFN